MSIFEIQGGPITHRHLMNKSKSELAFLVLDNLNHIKTLRDKVAELGAKEGMVCADCGDTGWLENRVDGRYPCTCMTEAEPYQVMQERAEAAEAKVAELDEQRNLWADKCRKAWEQRDILSAQLTTAEAQLAALREGLEGLTKYTLIDNQYVPVSAVEGRWHQRPMIFASDLEALLTQTENNNK